jgi:hypothetical protein
MSWEDWLNEYVCWDTHEDITRRLAIYRLCKYGLIPLLEANGYRTTVQLHVLCSRIATGMYNNRNVSTLQSDWNIGETENAFVDNKYHKIHYEHVLSKDTWDHFWSLWGLWYDVDGTTIYGWDRQNDIAEFMWTQINLEESPQMQVVNEMLGIEDCEEGDLDRRDAYVRDMTESVFH